MYLWLGKRFQKKFIRGWIRRLSRGILFLVMAAFMAGCGHVTFTIRSNHDANRGQPVYVLIRSINEKTFLTESYQDITNLVFKDPPDPSILDYRVILPGQKQKVRLKKPAKSSVGVYCMFTKPEDDQWKMILHQPLHFRYHLKIEKDKIVEKLHN